MAERSFAADFVSDHEDVDALWRKLQKPKTRVELKAEAKPLTTVNEQQFKAAVWRRDRNRCRCCGRKVQKALDRIAERGEVHHLYGRIGDLRFEVKGAILTCLRCHERLTGRVNEKWIVVYPLNSYATFTANHETFVDAASDLQFRRAV